MAMVSALYGRATASPLPPASPQYPLYTNAIILPILAFPSWVLCILPLIWHFSQRNIAAWSQICWIILFNFCNFINPLIWPRDNTSEWYDGRGLCDIEVRIFISGGVALPACTAMIMRKLAKVMDTSNLTMIPSRNRVRYEKTLEIFWCWGYPAIMSILYYIVQSRRYYIFAISGCNAPLSLSWVSVVLMAMWPLITIVVGALYAGLLVYRLFRYRREFITILSAQNTTKSRFIRLFVMSAIVILASLPYTIWITWLFVRNVNDSYSWSKTHAPDWNQPVLIPTKGEVRLDKWGQIATGYVAFLVYGTGNDAYNTYKRALCFFGLGKIFPSLYEESNSSSSPSSSFRSWCSTHGSKALGLLSKGSSATNTSHTQSSCTEHDSAPFSLTSDSAACQAGSTHELVESPRHAHCSRPTRSLFGRIFARRHNEHPALPLYTRGRSQSTNGGDRSPTDTVPSGVHARAWASDSPAASRLREDGVCITQELRQQDSLTDKQKW
ncbi:STE3-domain-containing protein [Westerdykella ornata]|uniref:STE3-domain-containing protein n=1 Tax=Westerdykella ornata TaxID=318751 RepID=A0A6A6J997_WESOR|nr:STE3-domain-containing protein [Westerdykella ornata]KAF2272753.1 STE3-domain-containing protein [Westerdykella ornata]